MSLSAPALAIAAALLSAADHVEYDVSLRTELRSRTPYAGAASGSVSGDLQLDPSASAAASVARLRAALTYSPQILIVEPYASVGRTNVLHRGTASGEWLFSEDQRLTAEEQFVVGRFDFSPLVATAAGAPPAIDSLPAVQTANFVQSTSTLGMHYALDRRTRMSIAAGYFTSGGTDEGARQYIPLQKGPQLSSKIEWAQSPLETFSGDLQAENISVSNGVHSALAQLFAGWQRMLDASLRAELSLGGAAARMRGPIQDDAFFPVAAAGLLRRWPIRDQQLEGAVRARIAPIVDRLNGTIYERAEASAGADYYPISSLKLGARAVAGLAVTSGLERGEKIILAEADVSYKIDRHFALTLGGRNSWLDIPRFSTPASFQWAAFAAVTVSDKGAF
jgi:hypothetical protein